MLLKLSLYNIVLKSQVIFLLWKPYNSQIIPFCSFTSLFHLAIVKEDNERNVDRGGSPARNCTHFFIKEKSFIVDCAQSGKI